MFEKGKFLPCIVYNNDGQNHHFFTGFQSARLKLCAYELSKKGSCPSTESERCPYPHEKPTNVVVNQRVCFHELLKGKNKCFCGNRCKFSHKISDKQRNDQEFVAAVRKDKDTRANKCINEFRERGSCTKKTGCSFSHAITDEDRANGDMRKKIQQKEIIMKEKLKSKNESSSSASKNPLVIPIDEFRTMQREFQKIKDMLKKPHP